MSADRTPTRHVAIAVGLLALVGALTEAAFHYRPHTFIQRDGRFYTNTMATLTDSLSLEQPYARSWYGGDLGWNRNLDAGWSNIAMGRNGEHYPKHPLLLPALAAPFFHAFDLDGALLFNLLLFVFIGAAGFSFARRHVHNDGAAALAALLLAAGTSVRFYAYDFHVDPLLLALFLSGVASLYAGRGATAGALVALAVTLKPTTLMWGPTLVLLGISKVAVATHEREGVRRNLIRAIAGGAAVLAVYALVNTVLFGRPWWAGYNRILVVVDGEPQVADVVGAFTHPFMAGLRRMFFGHYGLAHRFAVFAVAPIGLLLLARRAPRYAFGAVLGCALAVAVFAKYNWEGDRFLWPAIALLLPALAAFFDGVVRGARWLRERLDAARDSAGPKTRVSQLDRERRSAAGLAALGVLVTVSAWVASGPPLGARVPDSPHHVAARNLASGDGLDATPLYPGRAAGPTSPVAQNRYGDLVFRTAPLSALITTPAAAIGRTGEALFAMLLAVLATALLVLASRRAPPLLVAACALVWLPIGRIDALFAAGPGLIAATFALGAFASARAGKHLLAAALVPLAALSVDSPWLAAGLTAAICVDAWPTLRALTTKTEAPDAPSRDDAKRLLLGLSVAWASIALVQLAWWGRPFESAHDFVRLAGHDAPYRVTGASLRDTLRAAFHFDVLTGAGPGPLRTFAPLVLLAAPGVIAVGIGAPRAAITLLCLLAGSLAPALTRGGGVPVLTWLLLALPLARGFAMLGSFLDVWIRRDERGRWRAAGVATAVLVMLVIGGARRASAGPDQPGWRVEDPALFRHAEVTLRANGREVPCDFLAWEHQSWECSHFDQGLDALVGLRTNEPLVVDGVPRRGVYLPTGRFRQPRTLRYPSVVLGEQLRFHITPRGGRGATLVVSIGDEDVATWSEGDPAELVIDTRARRGERAPLRFVLSARGPRGAVVLSGGAE